MQVFTTVRNETNKSGQRVSERVSEVLDNGQTPSGRGGLGFLLRRRGQTKVTDQQVGGKRYYR